jgi:hypothetical protein
LRLFARIELKDGRSSVMELYAEQLDALPTHINVPCLCHAGTAGFGQHRAVLTGQRDQQGRYIYREGGEQ